METNLKEALKNADTPNSPIGSIACYSMNFAELASEINVHLEGNKVKFTMARVCTTCSDYLEQN